jgi:hypothetical protein
MASSPSIEGSCDIVCGRTSWYRVAHAAGWAADTRSALATWKKVGNTVAAQANGGSQAGEQVVLSVAPNREIEDDDLYRLQRDKNESEADYLARYEMLGCDPQGFIRLPRRT